MPPVWFWNVCRAIINAAQFFSILREYTKDWEKSLDWRQSWTLNQRRHLSKEPIYFNLNILIYIIIKINIYLYIFKYLKIYLILSYIILIWLVNIYVLIWWILVNLTSIPPKHNNIITSIPPKHNNIITSIPPKKGKWNMQDKFNMLIASLTNLW